MKKLLALFFFAFAIVLCAAPDIGAQQRSVSGQLAPTIEQGGWLIVDRSEKYLLLNARNFSSESWFHEGTEVAATGEIKRGTVTIYQEGVPFEVRTMRPVGNPPGGASQTSGTRSTTITVSGDARVMAQPDTAAVSVSVVTQNKNATEAQQQNAARTTAVLNALKRVAGAAAEVKTSGYSLVPQRIYRENQPPTITGYEARNSITVTMRDLTKVGAVIDAATQAGANNIDGIAFSLRDDRQARNQALSEATREALGKANALAQTLGGRVVRIVAIEEDSGNPRPMVYAQQEALASRSADTPIEVGTLEINSQVRLIAEIEISGNLK
ncbi:MAG: SIMPL domain-containing protein [Acidobacteria bacterium]|nr:SIMPL domain-containing protein [Acidobacteriota bacterium]MCA1639531.1 SIMPL domain-containing protein [Acidobacteriota bacterium]